MAHGLGALRFQCTRCGNCCRRFRVPLTGADLLRLTRATGRDPAKIVDWLDPEAVDMTGEPETFVILPEGRRLMVLAWQADGCAFLADNACSVHPQRPTSCHAYPFHAQLGKRKGIRRLQLLDLSNCEHTWNGSVAAREVSQVAQTQRAELVRYADLVQDFNRVQRHLQRLGKPVQSRERFYQRLFDA